MFLMIAKTANKVGDCKIKKMIWLSENYLVKSPSDKYYAEGLYNKTLIYFNIFYLPMGL
jgi:hypothetical protein